MEEISKFYNHNVKYIVNFNNELNVFYIIRIYPRYIERYGSEPINILGFEIYKDYKIFDFIFPYKGSYYSSSYGLGFGKDEAIFINLFNNIREYRKGLI